MRVEELRLNNLVSNVHNIPMIVKAIYEDTVYVDFKGNVGGLWEFNKYDPFKPIELTESLLFNCGFIEWNEVSDCYITKGLIIWKCNGMFLCYKNGVQIKYLHQLQNLYFCLVGKELEIEL